MSTKNSSVVSARVSNPTKQRLHLLAQSAGCTPNLIVSTLITCLANPPQSEQNIAAIAAVCKALGLKDSASADNIKTTLFQLLGLTPDGNPTPPDDGGEDGAPESPDAELAPVVPLSEYGYKVPSVAESERVAATAKALTQHPPKPARVTPFVVDSVTNQVKVNPARYARKAR